MIQLNEDEKNFVDFQNFKEIYSVNFIMFYFI